MLCKVCGQPINEIDYHFFHDDDCPNHVEEMKPLGQTPAPYVTCQCDNPCHAECCPVCKSLLQKAREQNAKTKEGDVIE